MLLKKNHVPVFDLGILRPSRKGSFINRHWIFLAKQEKSLAL